MSKSQEHQKNDKKKPAKTMKEKKLAKKEKKAQKDTTGVIGAGTSPKNRSSAKSVKPQ